MLQCSKNLPFEGTTRSQQFIEKFRKKLTAGCTFYNPDTTLMSVEKYNTSKCKVLIVFPTPYSNKTVSKTDCALNDYFIEHLPDCFVDFAYQPEPEDCKTYDDNNMPYALGQITHLDPSHFDIIGFSISVLCDIPNTAVMLKTFERCDKPIPLFWSDRKNLKIGEQPLIYAGGITAAYADVLFGEVNGKQAFLDFLYLGECDKTNVIVNRYISAKTTGSVHREQEDHYVLGMINKDIPNLITDIKVETIQDYIDTLFDCQYIYQPQAYEVKFDEHRRIVSNIKINPKANDFVTPYYPHEMPPDLGLGRIIINANGEATGDCETQISNGCSSSGICSFCAEGAYCVPVGSKIKTTSGLKNIETLCVGDTVITRVGSKPIKKVINVGKKPLISFELFTHKKLNVACTHKMLTIEDGKLLYKRAVDLKVGDWLVFDRTESFGSYQDKYAYLTGWIIGDGGVYDGSKVVETSTTLDQIESTVKPLFESLFSKSNYGKKQGKAYYARSYQPELVKFYKQLGLVGVSSSTKRIPDVYFNGTKECVSALIRGMFDSDGCVSKNKNGTVKISYDSCNPDLINDLNQLLSMYGIVGTLYVQTQDTTKGHYTKAGNYIRNSEYKISLTIVGESNIRLFESYIGFGIPEKQSILNNRVKFAWDTEYIPTFESRLKTLYRADKDFNKFVRKNSDSVRKIINGWDKKIKTLSKRHFKIISNLFEGELLQDYNLAKDLVFIPIINKEEVGTALMYDIEVEEAHEYVVEGFYCHNCGGWVEKSKEQILKECRQAKMYTAAYSYKPFSFNANYLTDYKGMLLEFMRIFPKVSFINMRMEELGHDVDAIKMMRLIGSNRLAAPIEGLSPRIQNNLLNKCLSTESLRNVMEDVIHQKLLDLKVGAIYTGYEEMEDIEWICSFMSEMKKKAEEEGGNIPIRLNTTPLIHYPLTVIEYLERKTAKRSYDEERWYTDEQYQKFKDADIRVKIHGFRFSTFIEQSFMDLGRAITPMLYKHAIEDFTPIFSLRSIAKPEFIQELKDFIDPVYHFADRDPEHYISPCHRIRIDLYGSYVPRARRLLQYKKEGRIFDNPPDVRCLKTYEGARTQCQFHCIKDNPLKLYNDVTLDEEGLHGDFRNLIGCERCDTTEKRKARLGRKIKSTATSEDIVSFKKKPKVQKLRFVISRNPEYDVLNSRNTAHTFLSKFLQASESHQGRLLDAYHSVDKHNLFWQSAPEFGNCISGIQVVDTFWSENVLTEVKSLIDEVNLNLKSVKVVAVYDIVNDEKLTVKDYNVFTFESSLPRELFNEASLNYKGDIRIESASNTFALEITQDKSLTSPVFVQKQGKVIGVFTLPVKYSPVNFLSSFLSAAKKTSFQTVADTTTISNQMVVRETSTVCKNCGKEKGVVSLITGKYMSFGFNCLSKAILTQLTK